MHDDQIYELNSCPHVAESLWSARAQRPFKKVILTEIWDRDIDCFAVVQPQLVAGCKTFIASSSSTM